MRPNAERRVKGGLNPRKMFGKRRCPQLRISNCIWRGIDKGQSAVCTNVTRRKEKKRPLGHLPLTTFWGEREEHTENLDFRDAKASLLTPSTHDLMRDSIGHKRGVVQ